MNNKRHSKPYWHFLLGAAVLLGGGYWILSTQKDQIASVLRLLPSFSVPCVIAVIVCDCLQIFFMGLRFWALYPKTNRASLRNVCSVIAMGQMMNSFLPARAGDFYKVVTLAPRPSAEKNSDSHDVFMVTGIFAADKFIDLLSFFSIILVFRAYRYSLPESMSGSQGKLFWLLILVPFALLAWHFFLKKYFASIQSRFLQFISGFRSLLEPSIAIKSFIFACLVWVSEAIALLVLSHFQQFDLSFSEAVYVLAVLNLALSIPLTVANIGPFEASLAFALTTLRLPNDKAIAIATVHHGLQMLAYVLSGGIGWVLKSKTVKAESSANLRPT